MGRNGYRCSVTWGANWRSCDLGYALELCGIVKQVYNCKQKLPVHDEGCFQKWL